MAMQMRVNRVLKVDNFDRFYQKSSLEISSRSILILALYEVLHISHLGVGIVSTSILSPQTILVSIHSMMHDSCT